MIVFDENNHQIRFEPELSRLSNQEENF